MNSDRAWTADAIEWQEQRISNSLFRSNGKIKQSFFLCFAVALKERNCNKRSNQVTIQTRIRLNSSESAMVWRSISSFNHIRP